MVCKLQNPQVFLVLDFLMRCQGAVKMGHLGALESVPPLELKKLSFSVTKTVELLNGEHSEDGQDRPVAPTVYSRLE